MANPIVLFDNNTNILNAYGVVNEVTGAAINDATVTVTLRDRDHRPLSGETWPFAMAYVAASSGQYRAILSASIAYPRGESGYALIQVTGATYTGEFELPVNYAARTKTNND